MAWGLHDVFRAHHPEGRVYSWWDYRQLSFPKGDGLRIDYVFANAAVVELCRSSAIDRDERKGKQPSDHAPVVVELDL
jgi:exodeoxyribonuclease-3